MNPSHTPIIEQYDALIGGKMIPYYRYRIPQNSYQAGRFGHRSHIVLSKGNFIVSDTHTSGEFTVEKAEQKKDLFEARFKMLTSDAKSFNRGVTGFLNLAKLFMLPTKDMRLRLNKNGRIDRVLNKEHVFSLWEEVYGFLASQMTNEDLLKSIKQKGDHEFGHVDDSIRKTELYSLFFLPVFDKDYKYGQKDACSLILPSQVLPRETIELDLREKEVRVEQNHIHFSYEGEASDKEILKKAKKTYGELINEQAQHHLQLELSYHLDAATGYPVSIDFFSKETLDGLFCSEQTTEIYVLEKPAIRIETPLPTSPLHPDPKPEASEKVTPFHSWILDDDDIFV